MTDLDGREDDLERLLAHLGAATVNSGLDERLTRGVNARIGARRGRRQRAWRWAIPPAAALAMAAAHFALWLQARPHARPAATSAQVRQPILPAAAEVPAGNQRSIQAAFRTKRMLPPRPRLEASFPAPPMPLTGQERLLIRVAHHGDPQEIAMLDPHMRALDLAADRAEFDRFLPKPPKPKSEMTPTDPQTGREAGEKP